MMREVNRPGIFWSVMKTNFLQLFLILFVSVNANASLKGKLHENESVIHDRIEIAKRLTPILQKAAEFESQEIKLTNLKSIMTSVRESGFHLAQQNYFVQTFDNQIIKGFDEPVRLEIITLTEFYDPNPENKTYWHENGRTTFNLKIEIFTSYINCAVKCELYSTNIEKIEIEKSWFGDKGGRSSAGGG